MSDNELKIPQELRQKFSDVAWGASQLASIGIFKKFSTTELAEIYSVGKVLSLKPGAHAVIEGEPSRGLFIIFSGNVSVYKNDTVTGGMHRIAYMEEGQSFGELSLFDNSPRSATVIADSPCFLFSLEQKEFEKFMGVRGHEFQVRFYQRCAEELADRFRAINSDYINSQQLLWKYALRKEESA